MVISVYLILFWKQKNIFKRGEKKYLSMNEGEDDAQNTWGGEG